MTLSILHLSKCCADDTTSIPKRSATSQIDDLDEKPFAEFDGIIEYRAPDPGSTNKKRKAHQITFLAFGMHTLDSVESLSQYQHIQDLTLVFRGLDPPAALSLALKENVLNRVKSVTLSVWIDDSEFDVDELTKSLAPIKTIQNLSLHSLKPMRLTDAGLESLSSLKRLKRIEISESQITDEGFRFFQDLHHLDYFSVFDKDLTGTGLRYLTDLPITILILADAENGNVSIWNSISKMEHLELLILNGVGVEGKGIEQLTNLKHLKRISLAGTNVDDRAVWALQDSPRLEELSLTNCVRVTDRSAVFLPGFGSLKTLSLSGTRVSDETIEELRSLMPDLKIEGGENE